MPVMDHLKFEDIDNFSAGLWSRDGILLPANAFQEMTDCYPESPSGGLRPFYAATTVLTTGIDNVAQEIATGVFMIGGYARRTGAANETGTVKYLSTWNETDNRSRLYRMDGTNAETTWTRIFRSATTADNPADRFFSQFARFQTTSGEDLLVWTNNCGPQAERGLYTIRYVGGSLPAAGDLTITLLDAAKGEALVVNQARILVTGNSTLGRRILYYSGPGVVTFTTGTGGGNITPQPNVNRPDIRMMAGIDPSEIVIGFSGAPWMVISGDIGSASTPVRQMGHEHVPALQQPTYTKEGILFMEPDGHVYATDGRSFQDLSPMLPNFDDTFAVTATNPAGITTAGVNGCGQSSEVRGFVLFPGSYCRWEDTGGWFRLSDLATFAAHVAKDQLEGFFVASKGTSFTLRQIKVGEAGTRKSTYSFTSAPFTAADGRRIAVREVQVFGRFYAATNVVATLLDRSGSTITTQTATAVSAGRQVVRLQFPKRADEYVSVKVAVDAGSSAAPDIEKVRYGFSPNAQLGS